MGMSPRLMRPRATGFNPKTISGLYAWWDATDASTLTISTGVSAWKDKSGTGLTATQSTGAYQPLTTSGGSAVTIGGKQALLYDLGDQLLAAASYTITAQSTFAVFRPESIFSFARIVCQESDVANATYIQLLQPNNGVYNVGSYIDGGYRSAVSAAQNTNVIGESHHSGSAVQCVANGVAGASYAVSLNFSPTKIGIGNSAGGSNTFVGRIGEVLIWNRALTSTEITSVRKYLSSKWGIAVA